MNEPPAAAPGTLSLSGLAGRLTWYNPRHVAPSRQRPCRWEASHCTVHASMGAGQSPGKAKFRILQRLSVPFHYVFAPTLIAPALIAIAGLCLTPAAPAQAAELPAATVSILAGGCVNCHGPDGRSPGAIPSIRGLDEEHLRTRLTAFREGRDAPGSVMTRLMKGYDAEQIKALAKWFAQGETQ
jgi:sulfide dehydrogenase cytochrome subunit